MADVRNRSLAEVTRADDFIVSDRLISLLLTQVSENKQLNAVFADLFDAAGSEIYLRPITRLRRDRPAGERRDHRRGRAAPGRGRDRLPDPRRGRRPAKAYGVHINAPKSAQVTFDPSDKVIVLAAG